VRLPVGLPTGHEAGGEVASGSSGIRGQRCDEPDTPAASAAALEERALLATWKTTIVGVALGLLLLKIVGSDLFRAFPGGVNIYLFLKEDVLWLGIASLAIPAARAWGSRRGAEIAASQWLEHRGTVALVCLVFFATAAVGVQVVYHAYALSLDEFLARFQARALESGHLFAPVPRQWRSFEVALQPIFMRYNVGHGAWGPGYRHGNAMILALFGAFGLMPWAHVFTATAALLLLARVTRRLWPNTAWAPALAVLLLATSTQLWITAMTSYAMTPDLLMTMAWLGMYLRDDVKGHIGALALAPLAIGIHHVYVHPVIAFPFLLWLVKDRRWKLAGAYAVWYVGWVVLWIAWRDLFIPSAPAGPMASGPAVDFFLRRAGDFLSDHSALDLVLWPVNLFRFVAWQNLASVVLMFVGLLSIRSAPRAVKTGAVASIVLLVPNVLLMPGQGHGWGYRFLHPALGLLILIAIHGAVTISRLREPQALRLGHSIAALGLISLAAIPLRAVQVEQFVSPFYRANRFIQTRAAPVVLVDDQATWFGVDLVRNDPLLKRPPYVLAGDSLTNPQIAALCRSYDVNVVSFQDLEPMGMLPKPDSATIPLAQRARSDGCSFSGSPRPKRQ
jgi:hypothetical protein